MIDRAAYSITETATITGLSVSSVQRWIRRGDLRTVRVGHRVLIPRPELERHLGLSLLEVEPIEPTSETPWSRAARLHGERAG